MPWHVQYGHADCGEDEWAVVSDADGTVEGCHGTRGEAEEQIQALYAAEPSANALVASAQPQTGAMIAWVPSMLDAERLAMPGGEMAPELHLTAIYLGEASAYSPEQQAELVAAATKIASQVEVFHANAFALALFNPLGVAPCLTLIVGGDELAAAQGALFVDPLLAMVAAGEAHKPWIPHVTLGYFDPGAVAMPGDATARTGGIVFDRLRVAFAGVVTDIPLKPRPAPEPEPIADVDDPDMIAAAAIAPEGTPFRIPIAIREGVWSSSGRMFAPNALTVAEPPFSLKVQLVEADGHTGSEIAGRVDGMRRIPGDESAFEAWGVMDDAGKAGAEAVRLALASMLNGVSATATDIDNADVELVWPTLPAEGEAMAIEEDPARPSKPPATPREIYHAGRVRSLTIVAEPDFEEARIVVESPVTEPEFAIVVATGATAQDGSYTITIPRLWPEEWFNEPALEDMPPFGAIHITASGRITGWLAPPNVTHRAFRSMGRSIYVPRGIDYSEFNNKAALVAAADGSAVRINAGTLTFDCGHANPLDPRRSDPSWAGQHYENSCSVAARVRIGEHSANGVPFVAGGLVHGIDASTIERMMGCALSGDWQAKKLKAALFVPVEGFPAQVKTSMRVIDNQMVASAVPVEFEVTTAQRFEDLARTIGMDAASMFGALEQEMGQ